MHRQSVWQRVVPLRFLSTLPCPLIPAAARNSAGSQERQRLSSGIGSVLRATPGGAGAALLLPMRPTLLLTSDFLLCLDRLPLLL